MKICFLENTEFEYSYKDVHSAKLRGAENIMINISSRLSEMGHDVMVFNNCNIDIHNDKSNWFNINKVKDCNLSLCFVAKFLATSDPIEKPTR